MSEAATPRALPPPGAARRSQRRSQRLYAAANVDRLTSDWVTALMTADDIVRRDQRSLVARSREQAANNAYARAFVRACVQNVVGPRGVLIQPQARQADGSLDAALNDAVRSAWEDFSRPCSCDITRGSSLRTLTQEAVSTVARDGEFFARILTGEAAGPWGMTLQMIDPQRCPIDMEDNRRPGGRFVRFGIEYAREGKPVAYYFSDTAADAPDYTAGRRGFVRVPAEQIIHGFVSEMPGQKRGLPWMATSLGRLRMLGEFENAALVNARQGAAKAGFFEWDPNFAPKDAEAPGDEPFEHQVEPGMISELPVGLHFKDYAPAYPSGELAPFIKAMLRGVAAGMGVSYNGLSGDLEGVNFSSIRSATIEEREHWKGMQEWLIEAFLMPVYAAWLPRALLARRITVAGRPVPATRIDALCHPDWQARRWSWIDPLKDVKAEREAIGALLTSHSQVIREHGRDPATVWREIAADVSAMREAGLTDQIIAAIFASGGFATPGVAGFVDEQTEG